MLTNGVEPFGNQWSVGLLEINGVGPFENQWSRGRTRLCIGTRKGATIGDKWSRSFLKAIGRSDDPLYYCACTYTKISQSTTEKYGLTNSMQCMIHVRRFECATSSVKFFTKEAAH